MKNKYLIIGLQLAVLLYSFTGYFSKLASRETTISIKFMFFYGIVILLLGLYAIIWQQFLKRLSLSTCFASRSLSSVYTMIIAFIVFKEKITLTMIIGALIIVAGVIIVVTDYE